MEININIPFPTNRDDLSLSEQRQAMPKRSHLSLKSGTTAGANVESEYSGSVCHHRKSVRKEESLFPQSTTDFREKIFVDGHKDPELNEKGEWLTSLFDALSNAIKGVAKDFGLKWSEPENEAMPGLQTFAEYGKEKLSARSEVSESDLVELVASYQLHQQDKGAAKYFDSRVEEYHEMGLSTESAVSSALMDSVDNGHLSKADADWVLSISKRAAQTDADLSTVSTSRSGINQSLANALQIVEVSLAMISQGKIVPNEVSLDR